VDTARQEQRSAGVTEVVEADVGETSAFQDPL
jgi:hypothetical protein